jgi:hypothetical protein
LINIKNSDVIRAGSRGDVVFVACRGPSLTRVQAGACCVQLSFLVIKPQVLAAFKERVLDASASPWKVLDWLDFPANADGEEDDIVYVCSVDHASCEHDQSP